MGTDSEYASLQAQRRNAQSDYNAAKECIEDCEYKIRRLHKAKTTIVGLKAEFKALKKSDAETITSKGYEWVGQNYKNFQSKGDSLISINESYDTGSLDASLDAVNTEITKLENLRLQEYGLLGKLAAWINSLTNTIDNYFN